MKIKIKNGLKNKYILMFIFVVAYRIIMDLIYVNHITSIFSYTGFNCKFDVNLIVLSWILLLLSFSTIKRCTIKGNFSDVIVLFLIYMSYIPFTTMVAYYNYDLSFVVANSIYWLVLFFVFRFLPRSKNAFKLKIDKNELFLLIIEILFAIVIIYISWRYTGFRFTINLSDVYTYRTEAKLASIPTILNYIFSSSKTVLPILLVYTLSKKEYLNVFFIFIIQILSFSINGSKTVLFSTLIAVVFYYIYNAKYLKVIPCLMFILGLMSYVETEMLGTYFILAYLIRRIFFLPNMLSALYFEFFTINEPDFYRQSFLRLFGVESPYEDIDHVIGTVYFNSSSMGANNGLISDAITNLGILGIFIAPFFLVLVLRFLDKCACGIEKRLYIVTSVIFAFIIISSFLPTVLLTHGLLMLGIVLLLIPRKKEYA